MSEIQKVNPESILSMSEEQILTLTDDQFGLLLYGLGRVTAAAVSAMAHLIRTRRKAGMPTPELADIWREFIPRVIDGSVLPDTLATLQFSPVSIIRAIASLPVEEQRKYIVEGHGIPVCEKMPDGTVTLRSVAAQSLTCEHVKLAFAPGRVRRREEQTARLTAPVLAGPPKPAPPTVRRGNIVINKDTETFKLGRSSATVAEVLQAIRDAGYST